ncbi:hypothetical protein PEP31012_03711 [Pandoraea eparura]|uniref:DNA transfer protein n=1 Tax=Pandoraea eparura TaxID=2508291 RepID=A0A5E4X5Y2_9BURK|nr:hypothetical protein [Pandoraea eparura]VVE31696.1 hypothetical protein PEP31012_03711 [Pandoraea eparura]
MAFGLSGAAIGGIVAGAGALGGAILSGNAAQGAAQTQADAANNAASMQNAQWQQTQKNLAPYLNLGSSAINPLLQAMGYRQTSGAAPAETRDQIYARLLPQYTNSGSGSGQLSTAGGLGFSGAPFSGQVVYQGGVPGYMMNIGGDQQQWQPLQGGGGSGGSSVDYNGLNAAVDAAYGAQTSNPFSGMELDPNNILNQTFSAPTAEQAQATPGYQFTLDQGLKSVQNSAAARGLGTSGAALKGAASYTTGLADSTYNDVFNRALNTFNTNYSSAANRVNRLSSLVGSGQNAAATNGSLGAQAMGNIGNTLTSGANALASGQVGSANALSGGLSSIGNNALLYGMMQNNANNNTIAAANRSSDPIGYMNSANGWTGN